MSMLLVLSMAVAAAIYVIYPLLKPDRPHAVIGGTIDHPGLVVDGVVYCSEEEWALEREMGKASQDAAKATSSPLADLDTAIEAGVAALRAARHTAAPPDGSTICSACGHPFRPGEAFCPHCGKHRSSPCPHCGRHPAAGDLYCAACGTRLKGGLPQ